MHELPKDLTKSLRSWRGSVVRDSFDVETGDYHDESTDDVFRDQHNRNPAALPTRSTRPAKEQPVHRKQWDLSPKKQWDLSPTSPSTNNTASPIKNGPYALIDNRKEDQTQTVDSPTQPRRAATFDKQTYRSNKKSIFDQPGVADLDGAASRFDDDPTPLARADFYELMGMAPPDAANTYPKKFAVQNGLYAKIKEAYDAMTVRYRSFNVLTYFLMTLQLLLSAVFIILGSLGDVDSHLAVAVLGALGTVVAGVLALMKGQGLPNRLRQGRDSLGYVLFEAQELWWDVGAGRPVVYKDIKKVREDFLRVMEDQRRNHPDTWNPSSNKIIGAAQLGGKRAAFASRLTLPLSK